jgi:hypothetical protein
MLKGVQGYVSVTFMTDISLVVHEKWTIATQKDILNAPFVLAISLVKLTYKTVMYLVLIVFDSTNFKPLKRLG